MKFEEILNVNVRVEDTEQQRRSRWKAVHHLYSMTTREPFNKISFENAIYSNATYTVNADYFVSSIIQEYRFPNSLKMDEHLRYLFYTFDQGRSNCVDWRHILLCYRLLRHFRFVRDRPIILILELFIIFTEAYRVSSKDPHTSAEVKKDHLFLEPADEQLMKIFSVPCLSDSDIMMMKELAHPLFTAVRIRHNNRITRRELDRLISEPEHKKLVQFWSRHAWERLSSDMRLTVMDEAMLQHRDNAEVIIGRYQLMQALAMYHRNTYKVFFRAWKFQTIQASGARAYAIKKMKRKEKRFFEFWHKLARKRALRRRRRILATVIGNYATKARCFERIKLFIDNNRRIEAVVGTLHKKARLFRLAGTHIREFRRLHALRMAYHKWWNICVEENNAEVAKEHNYYRLLRKVFTPWRTHAYEQAEAERQDIIVRENQQRLERMLQEAEEATKLLMELEKQREEQRKEEEERRKEEEKKRSLEESRQKLRADKLAEKRLLLSMQREVRRKRVEAEMSMLKLRFTVEFQEKAQEYYVKAKDRITAYIENPDNKLAIDLKFQQLKREFYANPSPETKERERILSSYKNILFLHIEAKLLLENKDIMDLVVEFDKEKKGYLTYSEFGNFIRSVGANLKESQVVSVIRGVDSDKDGYVDFKEIETAMKELTQMGVPGSPWKLYIDPSEDVICYHNFLTNEKYLEYEMNDQILRTIVIANMYGEAEHKTKQELLTLRKEEWSQRLSEYMARRLQFMYRQWRARKWRAKKIWKVEKKVLQHKSKQQRLIVHFLERVLYSFQCRQTFRKQLHLTIEKLYDVESKQIFYYNHHTQQSSWEKPHLLLRYGDVTAPCVWIPLDTANGEKENAEDDEEEDGNESESRKDKKKKKGKKKKSKKKIEEGKENSGYYHILAKREYPKKPDGFPLCQTCNYLLAVHTCTHCALHYCFTCHRKSHAHPLGFSQKTKAKRRQYTNPQFVEQLNNFLHTWIDTKPYSCDLCKSSNKLLAAFHCDGCKKNLCRQCFHRIHPPDRATDHYFYNI
eukprot:gene5054-5417_t